MPPDAGQRPAAGCPSNVGGPLSRPVASPGEALDGDVSPAERLMAPLGRQWAATIRPPLPPVRARLEPAGDLRAPVERPSDLIRPVDPVDRKWRPPIRSSSATRGRIWPLGETEVELVAGLTGCLETTSPRRPDGSSSSARRACCALAWRRSERERERERERVEKGLMMMMMMIVLASAFVVIVMELALGSGF